MAADADRRVMPSSAPPTDRILPANESATIQFAPISVENRITGNTRVRRPRALEQLTPGSHYDYGSADYEPRPSIAAEIREEDAIGFQKSMPPTFLRRTLLDASALPANGSAEFVFPLSAQTSRYRMSTASAGGSPEPSARADSAAPPPASPFVFPPIPDIMGSGARDGYTGVHSVQPVFDPDAPSAVLPAVASPTQRYRMTPSDAPPKAALRQTAAVAEDPQLYRGMPMSSFPPPVSVPEAALRQTAAVADDPQLYRGMPMNGFPPPVSMPEAALRQTAAVADDSHLNAYHGMPPEGFSPPTAAVLAAPAKPHRRAAAVASDPQGYGGAQPNGFPPPVAQTPQPPEEAAPVKSHRRRAERAAAAGHYMPRHGGTASTPETENRCPAPMPEVIPIGSPLTVTPRFDPWEAMGWKAPEPPPSGDQTAVWHAGELSMFERGAFDDPLDPFNNPPEPTDAGAVLGYGEPQAGQRIPMGAYTPMFASAGSAPTGYPGREGNLPEELPPFAWPPSTAYDPQNVDAPSPVHDVREGMAYPLSAEDAAAAPRPPAQRRAAPRQEPPAPAREGFSLASMGLKRTVIVIACALALVFCLVEVGKMVLSLVENEKDMKQNRLDYYQQAGVALDSSGNGVELLPAGETYTPTATPLAAAVPTETPRINQNDPLIGVMDSGAPSATFRAALPSPTAVTRTRISKYPDNPLLNISADFAALRQENPDVVGKLTIDGVLDENVVQRNNTFYITHNARGTSGNIGAVFVDESIVLKKPPENLLLRGQTTFEGKLFYPLLQYATGGAAFVSAHGIVTCNTIYENARYVIFAVINADSRAGSDDYFNYAGYPTFQSDEQMLRYVKAAKEHSLYTINVSVGAGDRLLTLATLADGSETSSLVLLCRMLRNGETDGNIQRD